MAEFPQSFLDRIDIQPDTDCWLWTGIVDRAKTPNYYLGDKKLINAHRFAYETKYKKYPVGWYVKHSCGTRLCVNPDHITPIRSNTKRNNRYVLAKLK